jgi:hypothetical protein
MPTLEGGWPFDGHGFYQSYLFLADSVDPLATYDAKVSFEYRGHGDAELDNSFLVHAPGNPASVFFTWTNQQDPFHNSVDPWTTYTDPSGNTFNRPGAAAGRQEVVLPVNSFLPFHFVGPSGHFAFLLCNDPPAGAVGCGSTTNTGQHFGLAIDGAPYATEGLSAWVGLSDLPGPDHDEQDLVVRVAVEPVPEPATVALVGVGLLSLRFLRRRALPGSHRR